LTFISSPSGWWPSGSSHLGPIGGVECPQEAVSLGEGVHLTGHFMSKTFQKTKMAASYGLASTWIWLLTFPRLQVKTLLIFLHRTMSFRNSSCPDVVYDVQHGRYTKKNFFSILESQVIFSKKSASGHMISYVLYEFSKTITVGLLVDIIGGRQ
jgi:hypothetical protein